MPNHRAVLTLAGLLFAAPAFCQPPSGGPPDAQTMVKMRVQMMTRRLSLTDAQAEKATTIFTDGATASETLRTNLRANRESLQDAIKKNDTAAIDTLAAAAGTINGQLLAIESKADAAFYAILTADQQSTYDSMQRGGGMGGPGGPGGQRFGPPPSRNE